MPFIAGGSTSMGGSATSAAHCLTIAGSHSAASAMGGADIGKIEIHENFTHVAVSKDIAHAAEMSLGEGRSKARRFAGRDLLEPLLPGRRSARYARSMTEQGNEGAAVSAKAGQWKGVVAGALAVPLGLVVFVAVVLALFDKPAQRPDAPQAPAAMSQPTPTPEQAPGPTVRNRLGAALEEWDEQCTTVVPSGLGGTGMCSFRVLDDAATYGLHWWGPRDAPHRIHVAATVGPAARDDMRTSLLAMLWLPVTTLTHLDQTLPDDATRMLDRRQPRNEYEYEDDGLRVVVGSSRLSADAVVMMYDADIVDMRVASEPQ